MPPRTIEFDNPHAVAASVANGDGFAISTPLCLAEAKLGKSAVMMARLPGPQFKRTLTLVARQRELGNLPRELCAMARSALPALQS